MPLSIARPMVVQLKSDRPWQVNCVGVREVWPSLLGLEQRNPGNEAATGS